MDPRERLSHRAADIFLARNGAITMDEAIAEARRVDPELDDAVRAYYDPYNLGGRTLTERRLIDMPAPVSFGIRSPNTAPARQGPGAAVNLPAAGPMPPGRDVTRERDALAAVEEMAKLVSMEMRNGLDYAQASDKVRGLRPDLDVAARMYYASGAPSTQELAEILRRRQPRTFEDRLLGR